MVFDNKRTPGFSFFMSNNRIWVFPFNRSFMWLLSGPLDNFWSGSMLTGHFWDLIICTYLLLIYFNSPLPLPRLHRLLDYNFFFFRGQLAGRKGFLWAKVQNKDWRASRHLLVPNQFQKHLNSLRLINQSNCFVFLANQWTGQPGDCDGFTQSGCWLSKKTKCNSHLDWLNFEQQFWGQCI